MISDVTNFTENYPEIDIIRHRDKPRDPSFLIFHQLWQPAQTQHGWPKFTELFVGYLQSFFRKKDCVLLLVARLTNRRIVVALSIIILIILFLKTQG